MIFRVLLDRIKNFCSPELVITNIITPERTAEMSVVHIPEKVSIKPKALMRQPVKTWRDVRRIVEPTLVDVDKKNVANYINNYLKEL